MAFSSAEFYLLARAFLSSDSSIIYFASEPKIKQIIHSLKELIPVQHAKILHFPLWDAEPYDSISPSQDILNKRINCLYSLLNNAQGKFLLLVSPQAYLQKIIPPDIFQKYLIQIKKGQVVNRSDLIEKLINCGYERSAVAEQSGEFSVRGSIIDICTPAREYGYRIDFFGDQVERIKIYNLNDQISIGDVNEFSITPSAEIILTAETIGEFTKNAHAKYQESIIASDVLEKLNAGVSVAEIGNYYSWFYKNLGSLQDYIRDAKTLKSEFIIGNIDEYYEKISSNYHERLAKIHSLRKLDEPNPPEALYHNLAEIKQIIQRAEVLQSKNVKAIINIFAQAKLESHSNISYLVKLINSEKRKFIICLNSEGVRERVSKLLELENIKFSSFDHHQFQNSSANAKIIFDELKAHVNLLVLQVAEGFSTDEFLVLTELEIFGQKINKTKIRKERSINIESAGFIAGDFVVHKDHGIGKFECLETVKLSSSSHDCIKILYDNNDKLYIPVEDIDHVSKYGLDDNVKLDRLGAASWQARKSKLKEKLGESAEKIISLAAARKLKKAPILTPIVGLYDEFVNTFAYVETDDQESAIEAVLNDLASGFAMDRLICGDVGFGKTEVAIRAAFVAVKDSNEISKNQVALICPTTLLARQHFQVFNKRLSQFGIKVAMLSRLVKEKQRKQIRSQLENGEIQVIIGTHSLLSKDVKFKNLSLLIIDEEQHFGVTQKEKLKLYANESIHTLTLSATPIPRTLQLSLVGIRDLSLIATAPVNRQVTKTTVTNYDPLIIQEALMKEYYRGGQSFVVAPRISDLAELEKALRNLVPNLKIKVAHGQMLASTLDEIMNEFYDGSFDVLLSTSIIESGLDIPKANTIIVYKADLFGLAALHQLRGRVGRSNVAAFAYFMLPAERNVKIASQKRLEILQTVDNLGAGFSVASHDMDIRGFGNLLGGEQSGHVKEVGVELYQEMLEQAINRIKAEKQGLEYSEEIDVKINLGISVLIPEVYVPDSNLRLELYQKIAAQKNLEQLEAVAVELIDRFGPLPKECSNLLDSMKIKLKCRNLLIKSVEAGPKAILVEMDQTAKLNNDALIAFATKPGSNMKIKSNFQLLYTKQSKNANDLIGNVNQLLEIMANFIG